MKLKYVKHCPACRSKNIILYAAGITGSYECKECGYVGAVVEAKARAKRRKQKKSRKRK